MPNKTMLATLALGTVIAFAAPAFADKMKATLDGKSQDDERRTDAGHLFHVRSRPRACAIHHGAANVTSSTAIQIRPRRRS